MQANLPVGIADQDHLVQQLAVRAGLGPDLPEHQQQFLQLVVVARQHKPDDGHQQAREAVSI